MIGEPMIDQGDRPYRSCRILAAALAIASVAGIMTGPVAQAEEYPTFMQQGDVLCGDDLDFTAYQTTGRFHTRGGHDSCATITVLTRAVLLRRDGPGRAQVRVVSGEFEYTVGWTNSELPVVP
jgi:hypothetical protein